MTVISLFIEKASEGLMPVCHLLFLTALTHHYKGGGVAPVAGIAGEPGTTDGGTNCFNLS